MVKENKFKRQVNIEKDFENQALHHKTVLNFSETCQYMNISKNHLGMLVNLKQIPCFYVHSKKLCFKRHELDVWLNENSQIANEKNMLFFLDSIFNFLQKIIFVIYHYSSNIFVAIKYNKKLTPFIAFSYIGSIGGKKLSLELNSFVAIAFVVIFLIIVERDQKRKKY